MAFTVRNLKDTDFETVVLVLITGTNGTAAEVVDASGLAGASTDPRLAIVSCNWSVSSTTEIEFHATSNTTALTLNGNGNFNIGSQQFHQLLIMLEVVYLVIYIWKTMLLVLVM